MIQTIVNPETGETVPIEEDFEDSDNKSADFENDSDNFETPLAKRRKTSN